MAWEYSKLKEDVGDHILGQVQDMKRRQDEALAGVKWKLAVVSGKGGVGKSAVTASLARALAALGDRVAVLDADLNGPSQGQMLAPTQNAEMSRERITPAGAGGIAVLGMDAFIGQKDVPLAWQHVGSLAEDSFVWRGLQEANALKSMMADTTWGQRDFLLVDLPPGTDRVEEFCRMLPELDGFIVVGVPSPVAQQVVARSLTLCERLSPGVVGLIENMADVVCPDCGATSPLFRQEEGLEALAARFEVPFLGSVPFERAFSNRLDRGEDPFIEGSRAAAALLGVARRLHGVLMEGKVDA